MLICDLHMLACQEKPRPSRPGARRLQRRSAERLLALAQRVERAADGCGAARMARHLSLLELDNVLGQLHHARADVITRLLILAHAGRASDAYALAHGGKT